MERQVPHLPVLAAEWLEALSGKRLGIYLDATLGAGGHAEAVLRAHPEISRFIAIDQDPSAIEIAKERLKPWLDKVSFHLSSFSRLGSILESLGLEGVDAMLFDLGVSSMQLDRAERGFSFRLEGPLDMRMDPENPLTAEEIVNSWDERSLGRIFRLYGEEKLWKRAARAIASRRKEGPISTTGQLAALLKPLLKARREGIHPATKIFQALRIAVNAELEALEAGLSQAVERLKPGGLLGVISFHSLEDRLVKEKVRFEASDKQGTKGLAGLFLEKERRLKPMTKKPITASDDELASNPRSRSAKLRLAERL